MVHVISHFPSAFEDAVEQCGGDKSKWQSYILSSEDPWVLGVEVNDHRIFVTTNNTIYNDTAKNYELEIK